jgi:hypothetical protein
MTTWQPGNALDASLLACLDLPFLILQRDFEINAAFWKDSAILNGTVEEDGGMFKPFSINVFG